MFKLLTLALSILLLVSCYSSKKNHLENNDLQALLKHRIDITYRKGVNAKISYSIYENSDNYFLKRQSLKKNGQNWSIKEETLIEIFENDWNLLLINLNNGGYWKPSIKSFHKLSLWEVEYSVTVIVDGKMKKIKQTGGVDYVVFDIYSDINEIYKKSSQRSKKSRNERQAKSIAP